MICLHWHIFCLDPTHFICVCKCTAHFPRRAFTRIFRVEKLACQLFATYVATRKMREKESIYTDKFSRKCAIKMRQCKRSVTESVTFPRQTGRQNNQVMSEVCYKRGLNLGACRSGEDL